MNNSPGTDKQASLWLMAAMSAPLTITAGKCSWVWTLILGSVCMLFVYLQQKTETTEIPKWIYGIRILWLSIVAAELARWSSYCWKREGNDLLIAFVLIILAWLGAKKGSACAARGCTVLSYLVGSLFALVLLAGAVDLNPKWIMPEFDMLIPELIFVFLLPVAFLESENGKKLHIPLGWLAIYGTIIGLLVFGNLSAAGKDMAFPFYDFSRSLRLFGVAKRFEALVSVAITLGFYSLLTMLFVCIEDAGKKIAMRINAKYIAFVTICIIMFLFKGIQPEFMAIGALICWCFLPTAVRLKNFENKSKKDENKA